MTEKEKMLAGELYDANNDEELNAERLRCKDLCFELNATKPSDLARQQELLELIIGSFGKDCQITAPFWCDYGYNIHLGDRFYVNHNCVMLDAAPITFGTDVFIGPNCGFYTSGHPIEANVRNVGLEYARPITIGNSVWIGGGVRVMPGVTIGSNTVIGAGSVVTKDIPSGVVAAGNPCRVLREIDE